MKWVKCTFNGEVYSAKNLAESGAIGNPKVRNALICPVCGAQAFYRSASVQASACFFSRHKIECYTDLVTVRSGDVDGQLGPEQSIGLIRISPDGSMAQKHAEVVEAGRRSSQRVRAGVTEPRSNGKRTSTKNYKSLLDLLTTSEEFPRSPILIEALGREAVSAAKFFVHGDLIDGKYVGEFHGYWGTIGTVKPDSTGAWLNLGKGLNSVGFKLPMAMYDDAGRRFRFKSPEDLVGWTLLYVGELSHGHSPRIQDLNNVCLRAPQ